MNILVTGATGFIGRTLVKALAGRGHVVHAAARSAAPDDPAARVRHVHADFTRDVDPAAWYDRLAGIDAVVNAVGLLRERGAQTFARVHVEAPVALFDACRSRGIRRVVQVSALGADEGATTAYHLTKRAADNALLARIPCAWVAQPSLVHGPGGTSARLFDTLASLPLIVVPAQARAPLQPIHLDDLVAALCALVERAPRDGGRIALVGPEAVTLQELLRRLRAALGLRPTRIVVVPAALVAATAAAGRFLPGALLDRDTLAMLARGNAADATATTALLGHPPRTIDAFIAPRDVPGARVAARLAWLLPLLRASIAVVWIVTGIVSLWIFPVAESHALLVRSGVPGALAPAALVGAAVLDLAFGLLVPLLHGRRRQWLWRAQATLIVFYSIVIALRLPEYWAHPYGPLLKNLPILAVLVALDVLEDEPRASA